MDRLVARNIGQGAAQGSEEPRNLRYGDRARLHRMGVDIDQPAVDLAVGGPLADRLDGRLEGLVVGHAAVDEGARIGVDPGPAVAREVVLEEALPGRPLQAAFGQQPVDLADLCRGVGAGKRGGGPPGEGEAGYRAFVEVGFHGAVGPPAIGEAQDMPVFALGDRRRIVQPDPARVAVKIGHRDEQLEALVERQEGVLGLARLAHRDDPVEQKGGQVLPVEGRFEPS